MPPASASNIGDDESPVGARVFADAGGSSSRAEPELSGGPRNGAVLRRMPHLSGWRFATQDPVSAGGERQRRALRHGALHRGREVEGADRVRRQRRERSSCWDTIFLMAASAYPAAGSFVQFVIQKYSLGKLKAVYQGAAWGAARSAACGKSLAELERDWLEFLRTR